VVVPVLGVLVVAEPDTPPAAEPVAEPEVPPAPIEVPLPVPPEAVVSLPVVPVPAAAPVPLAPAVVLLEVSLGDVVVDGVVEAEDEVLAPEPLSAAVSFFLPQAVRDNAAIRARAAAVAIGDLIIRNSLGFGYVREGTVFPTACGSL
jgi:hypothetical protein